VSICIGMHFGDYVILAADTRTTIGRPAIFHRDDTPKIVKTGIGLITGAGLAELLDGVKSDFASQPGDHTDDILEKIHSHREAVRRRYCLDLAQSRVERWITETSWLFTYCTLQEDQPVLRLGLVSGSLADALHLVVPPMAKVLLTSEAGLQTAECYESALCNSMKSLSDFPHINSHFEYHISFCAEAILLAAKDYETVGPKMTYGVHMVSGQIEISDVLGLTDVARSNGREG